MLLKYKNAKNVVMCFGIAFSVLKEFLLVLYYQVAFLLKLNFYKMRITLLTFSEKNTSYLFYAACMENHRPT